MTMFLVIGVLGFLVLLISLIVGELFDIIPDFDLLPDGIFSTAVIASFVAGAGFSGFAAMKMFSAPMFIAWIIAIIVGALLGTIVFKATRAIKKMEAPSGSGEIDVLVGSEARVITPAKAGNYGEISVIFTGMTTKINAVCDIALITGDTVVIDEVISSSLVKVSKKSLAYKN